MKTTQILPLIVAPVLAGIAWWFWCQFSAHGEGTQVLLAVAGGACGGCFGTWGPGWKIARLVWNAIVGACFSLVIYYFVRGLAFRLSAPSASLQGCGIAAMAFLAGMGREPSQSGRSAINVTAGRALKALALAFSIRGVVLLWH